MKHLIAFSVLLLSVTAFADVKIHYIPGNIFNPARLKEVVSERALELLNHQDIKVSEWSRRGSEDTRLLNGYLEVVNFHDSKTINLMPDFILVGTRTNENSQIGREYQALLDKKIINEEDEVSFQIKKVLKDSCTKRTHAEFSKETCKVENASNPTVIRNSFYRLKGVEKCTPKEKRAAIYDYHVTQVAICYGIQLPGLDLNQQCTNQYACGMNYKIIDEVSDGMSDEAAVASILDIVKRDH